MNKVNKILILGAGKVAKPIVEYLLNKKYHVTVASELLYQAELVINNHPMGDAVEWHSDDVQKLNTLVRQHKVVISLLPYHFHILVCKVCIEQRRSLVTTSYEQPGMCELHSDACKSNVTIINEMGLDPGIDHMWASRMIQSIKNRGGKVEKFISNCGALPSLESLDNPFRYKFSWSPMGVMKASASEACYLKNGTVIEHKASELMKNTFEVNVDEVGELEAYANRNSLKYINLYQIPEVETFFRGTLRYKGWCEVLMTLMDAGYFSEESFPEEITTYGALTSYLNQLDNTKSLRDDFAKKLNIETYSKAIMAMEWIGLFSSNYFGSNISNPLNVLANRMIGKMKMSPSDRDMVILNHQLLYSMPDGTKSMINGTFKMLGKENERTAIADTVSYPAALAVELLLQNKIAHKGIIRPFYPEIYTPILNGLQNDFNFRFDEVELDVNQWPEGW